METENFKPVELTLDTDKLALEWAGFTVDHLQEYLSDKQSEAATRELMRSIHAELKRNGGHIEQVLTKFLQYGRFYDMGVGRGTPIGGRNTQQFAAARNANGSLKRYGRKPVKWFSRTYYREVQRFMELYEKEFNKQIPLQIADALSVTVNPTA